MDNFQFTPITTRSPVGNLDRISIINPVGAYGWSVDPDNPSASNSVHCYVDTVNSAGFIGSVAANNPSSDVPYPGNHRFTMPIPMQYRDGNQHQMYCFGIDITGGDSPTLLTGSPKPFKFNASIGWLGAIRPDGIVDGWSLDPDVPAQSNSVHFYIDGPAGSGAGPFIATADLPRPDVNQQTGYPGNHGYEFPVPAQYRNNQQHTIYVYGIDLTGDQNSHLLGSPKTFTLSPVVQSTTFVALPESPLTDNHNAGGGKRIFPDKRFPGDMTNRTMVQVKARISVAQPNINVYFRNFDIDEPSTDTLPIDVNGRSNGFDNRGVDTNGEFYCPNSPGGICPFSTDLEVRYAPTDANGEAIIYFSVLSGASPGDNYAIAASTKESDLIASSIDGLEIRNFNTTRTYQIGTDRTEMLTVWRKLYIEIDSMGVVQNNLSVAQLNDGATVGNESVNLLIRNPLDSGRFQNGIMLVNNNFLEIEKNGFRNLQVHSPYYPITVFPRNYYTLYDDDDFNGDSWIQGFDADNGEDITLLDDSFDLMQPNDDTDCSDKFCNTFAAAYVQPDYSWSDYNTSDIPFVQNIAGDFDTADQQINNNRGSNTAESDDFWVIYIQVAYQRSNEADCDPNDEDCAGGFTNGLASQAKDVIRNYENEMPAGSQGSLIFIETMKDFDENHPTETREFRITTIPHEIGHQFGLKGDNRDSQTLPIQGIMGYFGGRTFVDEHLNIIRWRRKSPGIPR